MVHAFACRDIVGFNLVPFIADDEVAIPGDKLFFQPPRGFVVDDGDLQAMCRNLSQFLDFLGFTAIQYGDRILKIRELTKLLLPNAEDGQRRDDKHSLDLLIEEQSPGDRDGYKRFASANWAKLASPSIKRSRSRY